MKRKIRKMRNMVTALLLVFCLTANAGCVPAWAEASLGTMLVKGIGSLADKLTGTEQIFTIYVSGVDTRGDKIENSRSDVNIIVTVNTETRKILILSTPRDYFVPLSISGGVRDKLTHAGVYGIDVCVDTMEMLYGIDIDYYLRFHFGGFEKIVDTLGGIRVYSDYDFTGSGYHFNEGYNDLDGEAALAFVRERYAFAEGDRQRGRNQMHVMEAVLEKLASGNMLSNIEGILESISGSYETDLPYLTLLPLAMNELSHMDEYEVTLYSVNGTGATEKPYSMSENAYVMIPDMSTVEEAKRLMAETRGKAVEP